MLRFAAALALLQACSGPGPTAPARVTSMAGSGGMTTTAPSEGGGKLSASEGSGATGGAGAPSGGGASTVGSDAGASGADPASEGGSAGEAFVNDCRFENPIAAPNFPDPWIVWHDGWYYWCKQDFGAQLTVERASNLNGFQGGSQDWVKVAAVDGSSGVNLGAQGVFSDVWAPELHSIGGKWYLYASGDTDAAPGLQSLRIFVLEADSPLGPFAWKGFLTSNGWAIDPTVTDVDGTSYVAWSQFENAGQTIHLARLSSPWTLDGATEITISTPSEAWEKQAGNVNEGPEFLRKNQMLHVVYSASQCHSSFYSLGLLSVDVSDPAKVLDASAWQKKTDGPIFSSGNGVYGPGHNCFVKSPDGSEDWIVYHAHTHDWGYDTSEHGDRAMFAQKFGWAGDTPDLGQPVGTQELTCPAPLH